MNTVSSRERRVNNILLLAIFVVTALSMALAVGLGIFSASSEDSVQTAQLIEAAAVEDTESPNDKVMSTFSREADSTESDERRALAQSAQAASELKLQEVRDAYLQFDEAIDGVSVHYEGEQTCGTEVVCLDPADHNRILVNKVWASHAELQNVKVNLAQAHADLVVDRVWPSASSANHFLSQLLPACKVLEDVHLKQAAGLSVDATITSNNASVEGFKDIIVAQLVPEFDDFHVYPKALHTEVQVTAASQIAAGHEPNVVIPVDAVNCSTN